MNASQLWDTRRAEVDRRRLEGRSVEGAVVYELYTGLHPGGYLRRGPSASSTTPEELGVDFVEIMPVNAFSGTHGWGYGGVLWFACTKPYGGPDGLVRL